MVGHAVREKLDLSSKIVCPSIDLKDYKQVTSLFKRHNILNVIHLAARVGGVNANMCGNGTFFNDNIQINTNVLNASKEFGVKKVVSLLSTCIYPDKCKYPLTEDQIHSGPPHTSNYGYAYAKRMLEIQSKAYREQFGCNFVTVIPNNLYGMFDSFSLENSHVIPAIIRKIYEAKINNTDVVLWGDGSPLREFTYVADLADILFFILENYNEAEPLNVGNTEEFCISDVANIVSEVLKFNGKIFWDTSKPSGQFKKPSSNENLKKFVKKYNKVLEYTPLNAGLEKVCKWFEATHPYIRGF
jgi:GDP-L-fucose synthase